MITPSATWLLLSGIGTGADLPLLPAGVQVVGLDLSPAMLARARVRRDQGNTDVLPEQTGRIMGLKGTVGSLGNMLGPAALVLFTPLVSPQGVFLVAAALVFLLTLASGFGLRPRQVHEAVQAAR